MPFLDFGSMSRAPEIVKGDPEIYSILEITTPNFQYIFFIEVLQNLNIRKETQNFNFKFKEVQKRFKFQI